MSFKKHALIVAGGKGLRMKQEKPKPFLELCDLPILLHTINAFCKYSQEISITLVLAKEHLGMWEAIRDKYSITRFIQIQQGGSTRFQSVKNGLAAIKEEGLVAIHDGVRPLVRPETIATSFRIAAIHQTAVATIPCKDSIRKIISKEKGSQAKDRSRYRLVQTPQTFSTQLIKAAYEKVHEANATDDADIAEQAGHAIHTFEGQHDNIKITYTNDLAIAKALLLSQEKE